MNDDLKNYLQHSPTANKKVGPPSEVEGPTRLSGEQLIELEHFETELKLLTQKYGFHLMATVMRPDLPVEIAFHCEGREGQPDIPESLAGACFIRGSLHLLSTGVILQEQLRAGFGAGQIQIAFKPAEPSNG